MENKTVSCSVCGRPLKSEASILRGMGPKCAGSSAPTRRPQVIMKPNYTYQNVNEFIVILPGKDMDSSPSLTNAMDVILYELLYHKKMNIFERKIIYLDSEGYFDGVIPVEPEGNLTDMFYPKFNFLSIHLRNRDLAMAGYDVRRGNVR